MVNLIPHEAKRSATSEYRLRVATVWLFLGTASVLIVGVLLVPVSVFVQLQLKAYESSYSTAMEQDGSFAESEKVIKTINTSVGGLMAIDAYRPVWSDIEQLYALAGIDIVVTNISLTREGETVKTISVTGDAKTRTALASFRDRIQAEERFASAALPLSNLAKDKDVPFSITVAIAE